MSLPILSVDQMRAWEKASWAAGAREADVIEQVGRAVAGRAMGLTNAGDELLLLAGRGHNGDDVRAAASHLTGRRVKLLNVTHAAHDLEKLEHALALRPALVLDGLFGIGLNRALDAGWCSLVRRLNASGLRVAAIDVPSGFNAQTGLPMGEAVRASVTWTVGAAKVGLVSPDASEFVGRLEILSDVGLIPLSLVATDLGLEAGASLVWTEATDFAGYPGDRSVSSHKGSHGHAVLVTGSMGYHGAAVLAARGAMRAQPGLVTVLVQPEVYVPIASQLQAPMVGIWDSGSSLPKNATGILVGPGLAAEPVMGRVKTELRRLWQESESAVVVDASALDWLPKGSVNEGALRVMTPHPGEAARMLECSVLEVQSKRLWALRELSARYGGCWVVLKGHQTLVGKVDGPVWVNPSGNPTMAQGGAGDVLAGLLVGLLAQPRLRQDVCRTLRWGVWRHGFAADGLGERELGWTVEDLAGVV